MRNILYFEGTWTHC